MEQDINKYKGIKIFDGDKLVNFFVYCKRKKDGQIGYYNMAKEEFIPYDQPDLMPPSFDGFQEVDYIQSDTSAYIELPSAKHTNGN